MAERFEKLIEVRLREISDSIIILYHIYDNYPSLDDVVECCTYKDGVLVSTVNFPINMPITEEEIEDFLEYSSEYQKKPGYHRCPCEQL